MAEKVQSKGFTLQHRLSSWNPEKHVTDIDYADYLGVLDDTEIGLQESTDLTVKHCKKTGLQVNVDKTQVICIDKNTSQRPFPQHVNMDIKIDGDLLEQVSSFVYLGSLIACNGSIDPELNRRIGKASGAFNSLNKIWYNKKISLNTKLRIYESAVLTILLYAGETWQTNKQQIQRLEVFHQSCLRRILKVRYFHHVKNSEILRRSN